MSGRNLFADSPPAEETTPQAGGAGRDVFALNLDATPTEIYSQVRANLPRGSWYHEILEPMKAMGAGVAGTVAGGWSGLLELAQSQDIDKFADAVVKTSEEIAGWGAPTTQRGAEATDKAMGRLGAIGEMITSPLWGTASLFDDEMGEQMRTEGLGNVLGDEVMEATGNPYLAAGASVLPAAGGMALGAKYAPRPAPSPKAGVKNTPMRQIGRDMRHPMQARDRIRAQAQEDEAVRRWALENKMPDERAAGYRLLDDGTVAKDPRLEAIINEAERQGWGRPRMSLVQQANKSEREAMRNMLDIKKTARATGRDDLRPSDVVGDVVHRILKDVKALNRAAGDEIDDVARELVRQPVNFSEPLELFRRELKRMNATLDEAGNLDLSAADFRGVKPAERAVKNIVKRLHQGARNRTPGQPFEVDAYDLHTLKRFIDEQVNYGKQKGGVSGRMEGAIKRFRHNIDRVLDSQFDDYRLANDQYSNTIQAIKDLEEISRTMEFEGGYAASNLGQLMRRTLSNAVSRNRVRSAVDQLHRVHRKYGGSSPYDVQMLMEFADEIDATLGPSAPMSFYGQSAQAMRTGMEQAMGGRGVMDAMYSQMARPAIQGVRGINEKNMFRSMEALIDYMPEPY